MKEEDYKGGMPVLEAMRESQALMEMTAGDLRHLSFAFSATGNQKVANELMGLAEPLVASVAAIRKSFDTFQTEQISHGDTMMTSLLRASMGAAGAIAGKESTVADV